MSSGWWAQKLSGGAASSTPPTQQPSPPPQQQVAPQQQSVQKLPASATQSNYCPGCGSGNYGGGTPESRPRCYDCGYPITQSGTGMPGIGQQGRGPAQPAKQLSTENNYNPQGIIGHI